jgi:hypothetical protein
MNLVRPTANSSVTVSFPSQAAATAAAVSAAVLAVAPHAQAAQEAFVVAEVSAKQICLCFVL